MRVNEAVPRVLHLASCILCGPSFEEARDEAVQGVLSMLHTQVRDSSAECPAVTTVADPHPSCTSSPLASTSSPCVLKLVGFVPYKVSAPAAER